MNAIYWVNRKYKLIIYRYLHNNKISVIVNNAFNNLARLTTLSIIEYILSVKPIYQYKTYNS